MLGALNGYVLTKWRFRAHKLVFGLMLFACFIPFQSVLMPMATILGSSAVRQVPAEHLGTSFGFGNPTVNLVFVHVVYGLGFTTLFFRNYYEAFPTELVKAAQIDGASFFQIFRRILLPNSLPIIVVTVIYQFTNIWNDFLFASAYAGTGDSHADDGGAQQRRQHLDRRHRIQCQHGRGDDRGPADPPRLRRRRPLLRARPDGRRRQRIRAMAFLEIADLKKRFGAVEILKGIDLDLEKGGFLVLVGPSGCGKSTLLNTIAGLETDHRGRDPHRRAARSTTCIPRKRDIAMVFQSYALYPNMTVAGNIAFGMEMRGVPKEEREKAIDEVAEDAADRPSAASASPASSPAASASASPWAGRWCAIRKLFLFDEPLVQPRRQAARRHAHRDQAAACQRTGTTIVYVTHDQIEAMTLATKIAVLKDGELQQVGTPAEIYNKPANLFVADFMGSPAMNLIQAKAAQENGRTVLQAARTGPAARSRWRRRRPSRRSRCRRGRELILGIRPEAITDRDGADRNSKRIEMVDCACRGRRAGGLRHLRRHPARRQGGDGAHALRRRRQGRADACPSPSTSTRPWCSIRRAGLRL